MSSIYDVAIVGGGIVGLACAMRLQESHPRLRLVLLEKEEMLASHQTGHNSGVIHSGIYYAPGSLKARTCVAGRRALEAFCERHRIPFERCGKLIVALGEHEMPRLLELERRARANGVEGVSMLDEDAMRTIEPHVRGYRALHVASTGIVDYTRVARTYAHQLELNGGEIRYAAEVTGIRRGASSVQISTSRGDVEARWLITCGGLHSDRLAQMEGASRALRIVPFRGDYYVLKAHRAHLCKALIYPVPDPSFPFLGVHFTRRIDGAVWAGPNAVLAFARQGYGRFDVNLRDLAETLLFPGFWRLAARYWRTGLAEMARDHVKQLYVATMQAYIPEVRVEDVEHGPSGVRAQALTLDGALVDDFAFHTTERSLHVQNAPSPAATSSLGIADLIVERATDLFGLST